VYQAYERPEVAHPGRPVVESAAGDGGGTELAPGRRPRQTATGCSSNVSTLVVFDCCGHRVQQQAWSLRGRLYRRRPEGAGMATYTNSRQCLAAVCGSRLLESDEGLFFVAG
jgi:hypothetical protein